jgi:hypothetical protein
MSRSYREPNTGPARTSDAEIARIIAHLRRHERGIQAWSDSFTYQLLEIKTYRVPGNAPRVQGQAALWYRSPRCKRPLIVFPHVIACAMRYLREPLAHPHRVLTPTDFGFWAQYDDTACAGYPNVGMESHAKLYLSLARSALGMPPGPMPAPDPELLQVARAVEDRARSRRNLQEVRSLMGRWRERHRRESHARAPGPRRCFTVDVSIIDGPVRASYRGKRYCRTIQIRSDQTLADLHDAIFMAFDREEEHLYEFQFGGKVPHDPAATTFQPREAMQGPFASGHGGDARAALIGGLGLSAGDIFGYWFDFGDDWMHQIHVVSIDPECPKERLSRVISRVGKSPPQYR